MVDDEVLPMMHVQGDVHVAVLERTLCRLREIEASQESIEVKRGQVNGQLSVLEGMLIADIVGMLPDEHQQAVSECYDIRLRLLG